MADRKAPDDLTTLSQLDETDLLCALKARYESDKIYTYVGDILIAVNPFKDLPIYGKDVCKQYMFNNSRSSQPPHIYALAELAYQSMLGRRGLLPANQCILISGESGAGKTESTKFLLRQLMELCSGNTQLEQQILQVNPLLEAFGNAQTLMNDNSSRFGKYIQLTFHKGQVLGAKISEYLLEKSRLVQQDAGEENFHVFYYMFAGKTEDRLAELSMSPRKHYRYLVKGITPEKVPQSRLKYNELINALELVGFTDGEQTDMFTVLAGILHLGEVVFSPDESEAATIMQQGGVQALAVACDLLGIDQSEVGKCLTSSLTVTRGAHVERKFTIQQAEDVRDAMAKALYGRLFGWIVNKVNQLVGSKTLISPNESQQIGILDIFGFEHFEHNSFEQACINLANEQLQLFFNQFVFKQEQEEYAREGIDWTEVKFSDNQHLLDLFLDKPIGILSLLDEECFFPSGTDKSFVDKLNSKFNHLPHYSKCKHSGIRFTISHYAGQVSYSGSNWLEKNRDTFPSGIMNALLQSKNKLINRIFKAQITRTGSLAFQSKRTRKLSAKRPVLTGTSKNKMTVSGQFRNSLKILMEKMNAASPIFVRCLKPNRKKAPNMFDSQYMLAQLLYTGMLETVKIRRDGFAVRASFEEFVKKYNLLVFSPNLAVTAESCQQILTASGLSGAHVGKTKVFLRSHHVDKLTEKMLKLDKSAIKIQKVVRGHKDRKRVKKIKEEVKEYERKVAEMLQQVEELGRSLVRQQEILCQTDKDAAKAKKQLSQAAPSSPLPSPPQSEFDLPPAPHFNIFTPAKTDGSIRSVSGSSIGGHTKLKVRNPSIDDGGSSVGSEAVFQFDSSGDFSSDDDFSQPLEPSEAVYNTTPVSVYGWFKDTQTRYLVQVDGDFPEWFHGMISRRQAEYLLNKRGTLGCFLLRVSQAKFSYCLSFKAEDRCRHYMVEQLYNGKFIIIGEAKTHSSLTSLVQYYQKNKISNWDGFLTVSCGQEFKDQKDYDDLVDQKMIAVILKSLRKRPDNLQLQPTQDDGEYLVPQCPSGRNSYLSLLADSEQSASPLTVLSPKKGHADGTAELPPPIPGRPINYDQVVIPTSTREDVAPPIPDRPMQFKQSRLPSLPGETSGGSRPTSDSSRPSSAVSRILERPTQRT